MSHCLPHQNSSGVSQRDAEDINLAVIASQIDIRRIGVAARQFEISDTCVIPFGPVRGSIGQLLIAQGAIDAGALSRRTGPAERPPPGRVASSTCWATRPSASSATALSVQTGWPAIVLDESTIRLDVLEHVSIEWARIFSALVVYEDDRSLVVAAARPEDAIVPARELGAARGKNGRAADRARHHARAHDPASRSASGSRARRTSSAPRRSQARKGRTSRSSSPTAARTSIASRSARSPRMPRATSRADDELPTEDQPSSSTLDRRLARSTTITTSTEDANNPLLEERTHDHHRGSRSLRRRADVAARRDGQRALVVDPDPPGRIQLVAELEKLGWECQAATSGAQAVELLAQIAVRSRVRRRRGARRSTASSCAARSSAAAGSRARAS